MLKKGWKILLFLNILFLPSVCLASTIAEQKQALLETAEAFYNKDAYVQYDSYRKDATSTPEDASVNHTIYTDCGIFLYQVYKQALGIEIPSGSYELAQYANKISDNSKVLFNLKAPYRDGNWQNDNIIAELNNWLNNNQSFTWETGDLLVFRRYDGTGHVMMINAEDKNNIKIIESGYTKGGGFYDANNHTDKVETSGISISSLNSRLKTTIGYKNTSNNSVLQVSVVRFITNGSTYVNENMEEKSYDLTKAAASRIKYPGISITKTAEITDTNASVGLDSAVPGSSIVYRIVIKNNSNTNYGNITITEEKDSLVNFKYTGSGKVYDNKISWYITNLNAKSSYSIMYSVTIPDDDTLLGKTIYSKGYVNDIATATIKHVLLNALNKENVAKIKEIYQNTNDNISDTELISKIYNEAFGYDLSYLNNINLSSILGVSHCAKDGICFSSIDNQNIKNITLLNYYGLRVTPYNYNNTSGLNTLDKKLINATLAWDYYSTDDNNRAREIKVNDLQVGDIVLYKDKETKAYIYLGNKELGRKHYGAVEKLSGSNAITFLRNIIGDNYMILRPAIMMNKTYAEAVIEENKKVESKPVVTPSKKTTNKTNNKKKVNLVDDGIENPESGSFVPWLIIIILFLGLIVIKINIKNKVYRI